MITLTVSFISWEIRSQIIESNLFLKINDYNCTANQLRLVDWQTETCIKAGFTGVHCYAVAVNQKCNRIKPTIERELTF